MLLTIGSNGIVQAAPDIGIIVIGLILVFFGAALSVYSVVLLGLLIGGFGGYLLAPEVLALVGSLEGAVGIGIIVLIGGAIGMFLAYSALSFVMAGAGFLVGAFLGRFLVTPLMDGGLLIAIGAVVIGGVVGAWVGVVLTKTGLIVITSFIGAAVASRSLTLETLDTVRVDWSIEPVLFDPLAPVFLGLFILGILSQFGLFKLGWVTKIGAAFPGFLPKPGTQEENN